MEFQVGDRVRIRENFFEYDPSDGPGVADSMTTMVGEEDVVSDTCGDSVYLFNHRYTWLSEWLEPVYEVADVGNIELNLDSVL